MREENINTFRELAIRAKVYPSNLCKIVNGENTSLKTIERIGNALKCNPADLLLWEK